MSVFVTHKQWDSQLKRIEKANLKAHGKSLTATSMRGSKIILEIHDDRQGMMVLDTWREDLKHLYLVPEKSPQDMLQDVLLEAVARHKKNKRSTYVVRFVSVVGATRYKIYAGHTGKAFSDCKIGEAIRYMGAVGSVDSWSKNPIPFWPESWFKEEFEQLPLVKEYRAYLDGITAKYE